MSGNGNDSFTKVLLHFNGTDGSTTITDDNFGGSAHTWSNHTGSISTSSSKFGGASYNAGSTGWVDTPDHADYTLGTSDFTIDSWFSRQGGDGTIRFICGQSDSTNTPGNRSWNVYLSNSNKLAADLWVAGAATSFNGTTTVTNGTWHHAALVRSSNTIYLFLDGVGEATATFGNTVQDSSATLSVGRLGDFTTLNWNGFIDEFRLSVGTARWTTNFTPPTAEYDFTLLPTRYLFV